MKKEELRAVIVFCAGLFLFVIVFEKFNFPKPMVTVLAGGIAAISAIVANIGKRVSWAGLIGVVPAILILFFEISRSIEVKDPIYFLYPICVSVIIFLLYAWAVWLMKNFQDKHYPGRPRLKNLKKGFFIGIGITTLFSFVVLMML